ncbi:MAG TPA: nicotinate (nicotinamide) nucleotide adenylyltransferase [Burkholderiaceae bacterium]|nr:nicotinate (nicotinamide) nucleotide adenylyltransferase [Burkholderiaceae bacterium]HQR69751.1 nicotinate (nicotinamide) nucleotide adenylyltransferase [Burkholderiaceae bacterium]
MDPIGLLGGSFDPIHVGHLQLARDALANLPIAEVRLIPAAQPWQKEPMTAAEHRAQMIRLAIDSELPFVRRRMILDLAEIERGGPTYTIDTLRELRSRLGPEVPLVLIMGADQFERFDTWREWERIPELAHIAVARRAAATPKLGPALQKLRDARYLKYAGDLVDSPAGQIVDLAMTPVDASATEVRRLLGEARSPQDDARLAATVPPAVLDYIRAHHLYRGPHGH